VPTPRERVLTSFRRRRGDAPEPPRDERTLLQVLLGNLVFAVLAGGVSALLGSDAVEAVAFGVLIYVLFLFLDLGVRRRQGEDDGPPPG
jgi:hypothetical protein